ncbi:hypothetical protein FA95DRAFT_1596904 [Auriscalpium vulgare]|uniref:Uncharacterized protein n=1 Tax=Auriscalpium vulgare TaxID=40419 RepID=A0ACB8RNF1_9AGAM|nr:hypothetical protein FA95DRAFT_1596904 [Auriscalpium vulgare]
MEEDVQFRDHLPPSVPWVRLTWVCRRWRHVMLTTPTLWCDFALPLPPQWARAMLARSQNLPLSIFYPCLLWQPPQSAAWLPFDTLEQVRSIHLSGTTFHGSATDLSRLLSTPAPILEAATYINMGHPLPLSFFLPNIVSLDIHIIAEPPSESPSLPDFIAALQRLKQIETLVLTNCLDRFSSAPDSPAASQIARLASLKLLRIGGTVSECVGFLRHVQTPDTTCLCIAATATGGVETFAVLYPFLAPVGGYELNPFRDMQFQSYGPGNLTLSARHNSDADQALCDRLDDDQAPCDRVFDFFWDTIGETVVEFLSTVCAEVRVRNSLSLSLSLLFDRELNGFKVPPEHWLGMLGAATELQTLHADEDLGPMLCQILSASILEDGTYSREADAIRVWPKLQVLKLAHVDLSVCYEDADSWAEFVGMRVDEVLLRELEHRHQRGAALDALHLRYCKIDPQWLQKVEAVVGRVLVIRID